MAIAEYFAALKIDTKQGLNAIDRVDKKALSLGERFSKIGDKLTAGLAKARLPAAVITGAGLGIGKILINEAQDLQESVNAIRVTFGDYSDDVIKFGKTAADNIGLSASEFNSLATKLRPSLEQAGFAGDELNEKLFELAVRAADTGSIFNKDTTTVIDKFAAALRGSGEPVEELGVIINNAALEEEALAQGISKSVAKMSNQEKVALRLSSVLKQTVKNQGDFANTAGDSANKSKILQKRIADLRGEYGTKLLPVYNKLLSVGFKIINWFSELSESTQNMILKGGLFATALGGIVLAASFIVPAFVAIGGAGAILFAALAAGAALVLNYWEPIKAFFVGFGRGFMQGIQPVIDAGNIIINALTPVARFLGDLFSPLLNMFSPVTEGFETIENAGELMGRVVGDAVRLLFSPFEFLINLINKVVNAFRTIGDHIPESLKTVFSTEQRVDGVVSRQPAAVSSLREGSRTLNQTVNVSPTDPLRAADRVIELTAVEFGTP